MTIAQKPGGRPTNRPSEEELAELYSKNTAKEIAYMYDVPVATVRNWISYYRRKAREKEKTEEESPSG